ncbi:MAG: hypothetical protein KF870_12405 [Leadbetterella sp.]|nr:hypothetical protein [Leadbetterella sp.]
MKKRIASLAVMAAIYFPSFGQTDTLRKIHAGFIYPVSSNGYNAAQISNDFSLHTLSGVSKNENILSIAGISNHIKQDARGVQLAGVLNMIGNTARGVQVAGCANFIKKDAKGLQVAGLTNISGNAELQISGLLNVAGDVDGLQVAGLINKARNVKGVQLAGLINVAESSDYPIGIINVIKNGKQALGLSYDETGTGLLTYRSGGRVLYGLIGLGYNLDTEYYGLEAGIGAHILKGEHFLLNAETFSQWLTDFHDFSYSKHGIRLLPTLRIASRLEVFAGPTFNVTQFDTGQSPFPDKKYFWKKERGDCFTGMSVGYVGGVQISL